MFWYCTTYYLLEKNKPKYKPLEAPSQGQVLPAKTVEEEEKQPFSDEQVDGQEQVEPQADQIKPFILEGL